MSSIRLSITTIFNICSESVAKEGTLFSVGGGSQSEGPGPIKPGGPPGGSGGLGGPPAGPGGYQRAQRGSSPGKSPGQPGPRPDRFSKEEVENKNK